MTPRNLLRLVHVKRFARSRQHFSYLMLPAGFELRVGAPWSDDGDFEAGIFRRGDRLIVFLGASFTSWSFYIDHISVKDIREPFSQGDIAYLRLKIEKISPV